MTKKVRGAKNNKLGESHDQSQQSWSSDHCADTGTRPNRCGRFEKKFHASACFGDTRCTTKLHYSYIRCGGARASTRRPPFFAWHARGRTRRHIYKPRLHLANVYADVTEQFPRLPLFCLPVYFQRTSRLLGLISPPLL